MLIVCYKIRSVIGVRRCNRRETTQRYCQNMLILKIRTIVVRDSKEDMRGFMNARRRRVNEGRAGATSLRASYRFLCLAI